MPAFATLLWLLLALTLFALSRLPLTRPAYRLSAMLATVVCLVADYWLLWSAIPTAMERWGSGLTFDDLGRLLLPPLWAVLAVVLLAALFSDMPKLFPPLAAFLGTVVTAAVLSDDALFLVAMLQTATLVILLALLLGLDPRGPDAILRLATSLKYLTMSVVSGASLVVALLLISFYTLNPDRIELPRIIASLMVVGFGISVAAIPFYFHLPDLFDASPPAVTALLVGPVQGIAFVYLLRTLGNSPWLLSDQHVGGVLMVGGLVGAIVAGILGFGQTSLSRALAFSSIQEVGWLTFGIASATLNGWGGALSFLAARIVAKPLLVLASPSPQGLAPDPTGKSLRSLPSLRPTAGVWSISALAMLGFPLTAGFWGIKLLFQAAIGKGVGYTILLTVSLLLAAGLYAKAARPLFSAWEAPLPRRPEPLIPAGLLAIAGAGLVVAGIFPAVLQGAISPLAASLPFLH